MGRSCWYVGLVARDRQKFTYQLSGSEIPGIFEGKGKEDFQCSSLFTVYHRHMGFSEDEERRLQ